MSKVRIAILGCGGFAGQHAHRLKNNSDAEIVGLCDVSEDVVKGYIQRNLSDYSPTPPIFTDAAKMYAATKPNAVVIATPHTLHFEHAMAAMDAGLHVLVEKPMVTSAEHAHKLAAKAKELKKIVTIGYNTSCTPEMNFVRDAIRNKSLGKLELINGYLSQWWLVPCKGKWRQDPKLSGGGQAYDSGAHLLNSLCWSVESEVKEVFAFIDKFDTQVDVNSSLIVKFASGVVANITISGNCPTDGADLHYIFDGGRIDVDGWGCVGNWIKVFKGKHEVKYPAIVEPYKSPDDNFIEAILGRAEPKTSPANGIVQSELMDAIYESAETGKVARPKR
jgi:predicted dehydrogenase